MPDSPEFLIYAACYRLGVLVVGGLSIWLGFRLFDNATSKKHTPDNAGNASAEGGGIKLSFTNLLPGTYFALFGTVIIGIMVWRGEPLRQEHTISEARNANNEFIKVETIQRSRKSLNINLDGEQPIDLDQEWNKLTSTTTLSEAAEPLSKIAIGEAVAMARLAAFYTTEQKNNNFPISKNWHGLIIPFRQELVKNDRHILHKQLRHLFARFVDFIHYIHVGF
jgi:hypothetical protein